MEVISVRTFCQIVPFFNRKQALKLIEWRVLEAVTYGDKTFINEDSMYAALRRLQSAYPSFSLRDLQAAIYECAK